MAKNTAKRKNNSHHQQSNVALSRAELLFSQGHFTDALPLYELLVEQNPLHPDLLYRIGYVYYACKQYDKAAEALQTLMNMVPGHENGRRMLLATLNDGMMTDAMLKMAHNIKTKPLNDGEYLQAFSAFLAVCDWDNALPMLNRCIDSILKGNVPAPLLPGFLLNILGMTGISCDTMFALTKKAGELSTHNIIPLPTKKKHSCTNNKIKLAYLSTDFRTHPVGYFIYSILAAHDKNRFEVFCYSASTIQDDITALIQKESEHFIDVSGLNEKEIAQRIHKDGIHVLVELGGYTESSQLKVMAYRPAPVSIEYLGYANSTGYPCIDFRISDPYVDVPDGTKYTETLLTIPKSFLCFGMSPTCSRTELAPVSENGFITFGSFNHSRKINPQVIEAWSRILDQVSHSRLVLKGNWRDGVISNNILKVFKSHNISADRIIFLPHTKTYDDHVACYNSIDIALDTFPYTGTTTTCEALWMGVPVITLPGKSHQSRVSYSILKNIGYEETICNCIDEYISKAVQLASNPNGLTVLRPMLHTLFCYSPVAQPQTIVPQLENLYINSCAQKNILINLDSEEGILSKTSMISDSHHGNKITQKSNLRVIHNMARSGSTLISKCLGCMDDVTLLSEIHPLGLELFNPLVQASEWFGLLTDNDMQQINEKGIDFPSSIRLIEARCREQGNTLVLRDWAHLDYIGIPFSSSPTFSLSIETTLKEHFDLIQLAIVRHPIDQWLSLSKLQVMQEAIQDGSLTINSFMAGYYKFSKKIVEMDFIRYEDFTHHPEKTMRTICHILDIPYDTSFLDHWSDYTTITGDVVSTRGGRVIKPLQRRKISQNILKQFKECQSYHAVLALLGYDNQGLCAI